MTNSKRKRRREIRAEMPVRRASKRIRRKLGVLRQPKRMTEFEVQAELYFRLREYFGLPVRGEVTAITNNYDRVRFDLVVFWDKNPQVPVCIIECKGRSTKTVRRSTYKRQINKYESIGVPVVLCGGKAFIDDAIDETLRHVDAFNRANAVMPFWDHLKDSKAMADWVPDVLKAS